MTRTLLLAAAGMLTLAGCQKAILGNPDGGSELGAAETGAGGGEASTTPAGCRGCHGASSNLAPPVSVGGKSETSERGVGAHQQHLAASSWHATLGCSDCHKVPLDTKDPGHIDTALPAELTFSSLASGDGAKPAWDGTSCSGVYCHGATLSAGSLTAPVWAKVDGKQSQCGTCHGLPPAAPHPASTACSSCHSAVVDASNRVIAPALHLNGKVEENGGGGHPAGWGAGSVHGPAFYADAKGCTSCHGTALTGGTAKSCESCHAGWKTKCTFCHGGTDNQSGAPPTSVDGKTAVTVPGVGRHTAHLKASPTHASYGCPLCHKSPADALSPGHIDPSPAEVVFSGLAASGSYDFATKTCSSVYCHGNGKAGAVGSAPWVGSITGGCSACHDDKSDGTSMTLGGQHKKHLLEEGLGCADCHGCVVNGTNQIIDVGKHLNGSRDVCVPFWNPTSKSCTQGCHEPKPW